MFPNRLARSFVSTHHDERIARAEIDSCGIGFVADASGAAAAAPESPRAREIVELALRGLACVRHRAAIAADGVSGDGAGLLVPLPRAFFARVGGAALGRPLDAARLGVGFAFLDLDDDRAAQAAQAALADACAVEGIELAGWRDVPIDESCIGSAARRDLPRMVQALLVHPDGVDHAEAERRALRARRRAEARCREEHVRHYFASLSFSTVTYKALVISDRLPEFYPDLAAADFAASFAIFHSRFSTNTAPAWERAQPFRHLCHNGEINTVDGNEHRMHARGHLGTEEVGLGPEELFRPLFPAHDSDSGKLDTTVELLLRGGRDIRHVVSMLVPEAWEGSRDLEPEVRDYFRYHACLTEPWDGPAGVIFTDGVRVGAALDRNGLRPLRWARCEDGTVAACSEAGAVPVTGRGRVQRGRLGPGEMLCVDPRAAAAGHPGWQDDAALKRWLASRAPYGDWARDGLLSFLPGHAIDMPPLADELVPEQATFGLNREEVVMVLKPMATDAKEPTFSMGDDTPLAAVAGRARPGLHNL
jgi:glutamate synthase domain-containing protein 1